MRTVQVSGRRSFWLIVSLVTALTFVLTACGANSSSGSASPSPTSTGVNVHGCPNNIVVGTTPAPATMVLKPSDSKTTVNAHLGDVIEIQLPFGQAWSGPTTSQGTLELQIPAGYASNTTNACIWRFTAKGSGTTQLNFYGRAICKKGQFCPQYIMSLPFTISVK